MPIRISSELPAFKTLGEENIFVMSKERAEHQDIRPLKVIILNIMPKKIETESQLMRLLSNTPLQVDVELLQMASHVSRNTSSHHLDSFYKTFDEISDNRYDGMIITGAPVELLDFEQVDYWKEITNIMEWSKTHVFSTIYICWAAQAGLYYHYGIPKYTLDQKMFGIFPHRAEVSNCQLLRGFDDIFYVPHSRNTEVRREDIERIPQLEILTSSEISGVHIVANKNGRQYFITGHSEYDRDTIANEYRRDVEKGIDIQIPYNYFPNDDPNNMPVFSWRCTANLMFSNWLNYCVYQKTPYNLEELEVRNWNWETSL
ncbi:homoserine O-acetyltransferase MetA [Ruminococcus flavefaciens]|jgi:homoserine O-succinyltransferase|uniref:Homoserine O-acetyltransferase n=1 Tax=Ruminococcus flavefaciens TaxID=1265 RepID=A0A1K1LMS0_RUMFL|nr:homoserine O-succinyltransferase [Ruminococcus flavefaciens]SFW12200.1 homoserine O-succinyltransferase [Ruminococcus flavefaciens]